MITVHDQDGVVVFDVRTAYSPSMRVSKLFKKKSRTKASMQAECDINVIMAKYAKSGLIEAAQKAGGQYGDFSEISSYQDALNQVIDANERFAALPASVRKRFNNDPGELLDFMADGENLEEARKLGLIPPEQNEKEAGSPPPKEGPDKGPPVTDGSDPGGPGKAAPAAS